MCAQGRVFGRCQSFKLEIIANTLLIGLGVETDKITPSAREETGRELLALLASSSESRLEAYLLSLLLLPKVYVLTAFVNCRHMRRTLQ
jgi:hypothetical protein